MTKDRCAWCMSVEDLGYIGEITGSRIRREMTVNEQNFISKGSR